MGKWDIQTKFQHTAARRRLQIISLDGKTNLEVSTHSRAEAAALVRGAVEVGNMVSTHSRAEAAANLSSVYINA